MTRLAGPAALALALVWFLAADILAQPVPQFREYAVASVYTGPVAQPDLSGEQAQMFRTRLRNAAESGRIGFAGRYIITTWGCGSSCVDGALLDAVDGSVHFFPGTICCARATHDGFRVIEVRPDSRLIIFAGLINEEDPMGAHFFEFRDERFVMLTTIPDDGTFQ